MRYSGTPKHWVPQRYPQGDPGRHQQSRKRLQKFKENESLTPRDIDKELNLPAGTSFEMSSWSDYFEHIYEDGDD